MQTSDNERRWVGAWHVPLNIAAMHVSGVLLLIGLGSHGVTWALGLVIHVLMLHVAVQIPTGLLLSPWAVRGQVGRAGLAVLGVATSVAGVLCLVTSPHVPWDFVWRNWGCLSVSLGSYVWLCTLRRSTVARIAERITYPFQTLVMWALLRPPRRGPH